MGRGEEIPARASPSDPDFRKGLAAHSQARIQRRGCVHRKLDDCYDDFFSSSRHSLQKCNRGVFVSRAVTCSSPRVLSLSLTLGEGRSAMSNNDGNDSLSSMSTAENASSGFIVWLVRTPVINAIFSRLFYEKQLIFVVLRVGYIT